MKRYLSILSIGLFALSALGSCVHTDRSSIEITDTIYAPRHAQDFLILQSPQGVILQVNNQGSHSLFLLSEQSDTPLPNNCKRISRPIERVACISSSHITFLSALGMADRIVGVSTPDYISDTTVQKNIAQGKTKDIGYEAAINYETLSSIRTDILLSYGLQGKNNKYRELKIDNIPIGDYLESTPLARAEWIVFVGEVMGCRQKAEDIFDSIEMRYTQLQQLVQERVHNRPKVMINTPWQDVWYVPRQNNYMTRLIEDAGGHCLFSTDKTSDNAEGSSRAISAEQAFLWISTADVWLNPGSTTSLKELCTIDKKFSNTEVVRNRRVFNNNLRLSPAGGSDVWESGALRADLVLADMIALLHTDLLTDHQYTYYRRLE